MCDISECFIWLNGTAWTGLSAVATFLAVLVALFLPGYQEYKQNQNIVALIEKELEENYSRLVKTENWKDQTINGQSISALSQKFAIAEHISLKIWSEYKYKLAVYSSEEYEKFNAPNDVLDRILDSRKDYLAGIEPEKTRASMEIEKKIDSFLCKCKEVRKLS
ncbi:MAG: hypothetical protein KJ795_09210 [Gammaproteobacteria bacterium]|nr:hypothetical protein [Gammaproteobacteria bacterium]MBU1775144.1 hypothetical protein [Gammaproteobacteria bacterium]MBU1967947.1 hypothetical protein [Gammaproteobacteria bacterium]